MGSAQPAVKLENPSKTIIARILLCFCANASNTCFRCFLEVLTHVGSVRPS